LDVGQTDTIKLSLVTGTGNIVMNTVPVDVNGDGRHEILFQSEANPAERAGTVITRDGTELGSVGSRVN